MKTKFSKLISRTLLFLLIAIIAIGSCVTASAEVTKSDQVPYETYTYWNEFSGKTRKDVYSKPMHQVEKVLTNEDLGLSEDSKLTDVHSADNGYTYVLDGGVSKVYIFDKDYKLIKTIGNLFETKEKMDAYNAAINSGAEAPADAKPLTFKDAPGIFVDKQNFIYIADKVGKRVLKFNEEGIIDNIYTLPKADIIPSDFKYQPIKIAVDREGYLYVLSQGSYYGAILYSPEEEFLGFFGSLKVKATLSQAVTTLWNRLFMNAEKISRDIKTLPNTFTDMWIDDEDFVYIATGEDTTDKGHVKRLNPGGIDILGCDEINFADEGADGTLTSGMRKQSMCGLSVDKAGFIYLLDNVYGKIYLYDEEGTLLQAFGGGVGSAEQDGLLQQPSGITVNGGDIVVVDNTYNGNAITVYRTNEYGALVKKAQALTLVGDYAESHQYWEEVIKLDKNNQAAYSGIAKSYLVAGEIDKALEYARTGYDRETYSLAFQDKRTEILEKNFTWVAIIAVVVVGLFLWLIVYTTKHNVSIIKNEKVRNMTTVIFHPFDCFRNVKEKGLISIPICIAIVILYYIFSVMTSTVGGFPFVYFDPSSYNALFILLQTVGIVVLWTISNWAVCTLMSGKGKLKEIFTVMCYSLVPSLIGSICFVVLTNVLVPDEITFITIFMNITTWYTYILLAIGSIQIHDYSLGKFIWTAFLTILGIAIIIFLAITIIILIQQTWGFVVTLYREVIRLF